VKKRVIVNTDAKNEADDQFAIVHALLSESLDIVGVIPGHFGTHRTDESMLESRAEVDLLIRLLALDHEVVVANGAPTKIPDPKTAVDSAGARLIVEAAHQPGALFVLFLGPLTDMASAILLDESILENPDLTVVWIGGEPYDGAHGSAGPAEFNLSNDVSAANVVLQSGVRVWQIPWTVYSMVNVGHAELDEKVAPYGDIGEYLVRQLKEFNAWYGGFRNDEFEYRSLGDSPAVAVTLNPGAARWRIHPVRVFDSQAQLTAQIVEGRTVRVADSIDARYLLEDFFAKLKAHHARRAASVLGRPIVE
jgi:inosine-uridine nucleoside N-ribohydrolase